MVRLSAAANDRLFELAERMFCAIDSGVTTYLVHPGSSSAMSHASVWLERFACFDQCLEAGEDAWPAIGGRGVGSIVLRPPVMRHRDPGGFGLRYKFYRDARDLGGRADGKCVLQQPWRLRLEHLAANVGGALAVGTNTDPVHRASWLKIDFELGPSKDDAVGFGGDEALPDPVRRCGEVEDEVQWSLLGHVISFRVCVDPHGIMPLH